ncbi:unnamed protein product [Amoebophrya sp. A25]|nr:unnamed protein product [Amoebophrya sp. A25]|eukprot:GSA25T00026043001.1
MPTVATPVDPRSRKTKLQQFLDEDIKQESTSPTAGSEHASTTSGQLLQVISSTISPNKLSSAEMQFYHRDMLRDSTEIFADSKAAERTREETLAKRLLQDQFSKRWGALVDQQHENFTTEGKFLCKCLERYRSAKSLRKMREELCPDEYQLRLLYEFRHFQNSAALPTEVMFAHVLRARYKNAFELSLPEKLFQRGAVPRKDLVNRAGNVAHRVHKELVLASLMRNRNYTRGRRKLGGAKNALLGVDDEDRPDSKAAKSRPLASPVIPALADGTTLPTLLSSPGGAGGGQTSSSSDDRDRGPPERTGVRTHWRDFELTDTAIWRRSRRQKWTMIENLRAQFQERKRLKEEEEERRVRAEQKRQRKIRQSATYRLEEGLADIERDQVEKTTTTSYSAETKRKGFQRQAKTSTQNNLDLPGSTMQEFSPSNQESPLSGSKVGTPKSTGSSPTNWQSQRTTIKTAQKCGVLKSSTSSSTSKNDDNASIASSSHDQGSGLRQSGAYKPVVSNKSGLVGLSSPSYPYADLIRTTKKVMSPQPRRFGRNSATILENISKEEQDFQIPAEHLVETMRRDNVADLVCGDPGASRLSSVEEQPAKKTSTHDKTGAASHARTSSSTSRVNVGRLLMENRDAVLNHAGRHVDRSFGAVFSNRGVSNIDKIVAPLPAVPVRTGLQLWRAQSDGKARYLAQVRSRTSKMVSGAAATGGSVTTKTNTSPSTSVGKGKESRTMASSPPSSRSATSASGAVVAKKNRSSSSAASSRSAARGQGSTPGSISTPKGGAKSPKGAKSKSPKSS